MDYHALRNKEIRKYAPKHIGIYFLGDLEKGKFTVRYVGRSDWSIQNRLLNHPYKMMFGFFSYQKTATIKDAFLLETENYYLYKNTLINKIHPDLPKNLILEHPSDTLGRIFKKRILKGVKYGRN